MKLENDTMKTPFTKNSETTPSCAFLDGKTGHDVITLHRVMPDEVDEKEHKDACLSDEAWQDAINLVDAAPFMLEVLQALEAYEDVDPAEGTREYELMILRRKAIARATGLA